MFAKIVQTSVMQIICNYTASAAYFRKYLFCKDSVNALSLQKRYL